MHQSKSVADRFNLLLPVEIRDQRGNRLDYEWNNTGKERG